MAKGCVRGTLIHRSSRLGDGFIYLPQIVELWGSADKFYELNTDGDDYLTFREIENGMTLQDFYEQFDFNGIYFILLCRNKK